jgi:Fungal specific transcription factor domain/Fungal Zn(2)-Cys(6) binuclear cluster domain
MCKARKVKCDRVEPACRSCRLHNRECVYKERKKPGLQASYGFDMEDKVNRMEANLNLLARRVEDISKGYEPGDQGATSKERYAESLYDTDERAHTSPPTSHSAAARQSDSPSSAKITVQPFIDLRMDGNPICSWPTRTPQLMRDIYKSDLPPYHLLYDLIDLFFKHIITWAPILDRKATFAILSPATSPDEEGHIILHAIVVTALRFSEDSNLTPDLRIWYEKNSKQKVQIFALENSSIKALQALALVTLSVLGTSEGPEGGRLLAQLARSIVQLDIGIEKGVFLERTTDFLSPEDSSYNAPPRSKNWVEEEGRRRLVWLVYLLDRYATIATHLDFILDESAVDTQLPCRYDLFCQNTPVETRHFRSPDSTEVIFSKAENLGSFSYHCEVLRILSRIHRFLHRPVDILSARDVRRWRDTFRELDGELDDWHSRLPGEHDKVSQLCHPDPAARVSNWIMIHAAFVVAVIRLHSVAAYPVVQSHLFMPSHNAMQRCLAAVESLTAITQEVTEAGVLSLLGTPFAFTLWVAGRLSLVHASTMQCDVDPNIWYLIDTLERMSQYWAVARSYADSLRKVVKRGQKSAEDIHSDAFGRPGVRFKAMRR